MTVAVAALTLPIAAEVAEGLPLWRKPALRADRWSSVLGASGYLTRAVRFGVRDMPTVPFTEGVILPAIPQTEEDRAFARNDLREGLRRGVYERVSGLYVREQVARGRMVSSAFTTWQGDGADRRGRFVINLHRQSKHWPYRGVKMETMSSFSVELEQDDYLMSWDIRSGYRHLRLHQDMRDFFLFRYAGEFYRCVALPFCWGPSALWFTKLMRPVVQYIREKWGWRVLP